MTAAQLNDLDDQIGVTHAEHKVKADINGSLIEWLDTYVVFLSQAMKASKIAVSLFIQPSAGELWLSQRLDALNPATRSECKRGNGDYLDLVRFRSLPCVHIKDQIRQWKVVKLIR